MISNWLFVLHRLAYDESNKGPAVTILRRLLSFLSFLYYLGIMSKRALLNAKVLTPRKLDCMVISVGNITWGGTGKTPLIEMLAKVLTAEGRKVAVLLRGYGKKVSAKRKPAMEWMETGDEANLLKKNLPGIHILADKDRLKSGRLAIKEYGVDTLLLDDGYQHWKIDRDFDIVAINGNNPFGNGRLLPRGILREPISAISRADIVCFTKVDDRDTTELQVKLKDINHNLLFVESIHTPVYLYDFYAKKRLIPEDIRGNSVILFSGIGDPDSFKDNIIRLGAKVKTDFRYPDHYVYLKKDIENIFIASREAGADAIITTEKDMVKAGPLLNEFQYLASKPVRFLSLRIELKIIKNERELIDRLVSISKC